MITTFLHVRSSRLVSLAILGLLAAMFAVSGPVAAADDLTITQAELLMVDKLNADRTAVGLVPVRVDTRLMAIARARSADMAAKGYFDHTQPDGRNVFDILTAQGITWYTAGEIIATNNYPTLANSVDAANAQWMASPGHKAIVVSTSMNYVGVGLAIEASTGKKLWTAVYIKGPDRTGAKAATATPTVSSGTTTATRRVSVSWSGADVPLQVLTSGFHSYQVQRRVDGGAWTTVWASTTVRSMTLTLATNHTYEFRVAARDNAGNWGAWSTVKTALGRSVGIVVIRR
jgi:uncharacterized protein YkwD